MDATITTWMSLVEYFLPIFTRPTREIFIRLTMGWILCTARRTITGILPFADPLGIRAHDAYHRFLPDGRWKMSGLWKTLAMILVHCFCRNGTITLALDDTLFHRSGRKVEGAGYWRDAVRSTKAKIVYAWGLNLVVLTLQIQPPWGGEPLGLPINMRLHRKKKASLIELAEQMLDEVRQRLPQRRFRVVGDGFYATLAGKELAGIAIISRMKRNAELYDLPPASPQKRRGRPRKKGRRLPCPEKMAGRARTWQKVKVRERGKIKPRLVHAREVLWYRVCRRPVLLVISRDPEGKEKDDFFFTTDITMTPAEVIGMYADRWSIEDTFKYTKQYLGGQELQTFKRLGPERAAGVSLWLYSTIWLWYLKQKSNQRYFLVPPWNPGKALPSFLDALKALRRELWSERIKTMFGISVVHDKKYEFLMEALASAA